MKPGNQPTLLSNLGAGLATNLLSMLLSLLMRWPPTLTIMGLVLLFAGLFGSVHFWSVLQRYPARPVHLQLAAAAAIIRPGRAAWVTLDGVVWDCGYLRYGNSTDINVQTDIRFTDAAHSAWGIASFRKPQKITCDQTAALAATGILTSVKAPTGEVSLRLCTWCGRGNDRWGLILSLIAGAMGTLFVSAAVWNWVRPRTRQA